jgi:hypothetical protein
MIRLRPYEDGDIEAIGDAVEPFLQESKYQEHANQGLYMTMELDGDPVACGGLVMADSDNAEAWIKVSNSLLKKTEILVRIQLINAFEKALDIIDESLGFPVIFAAILDGFLKGERFAEAIGFRRIGESCKKDSRSYNYYRKIMA